jgi:actin-related protein 8
MLSVFAGELNGRRLQAIATPLVPNMEKVQIIPPPKEVDPRVLAWKGAAVLGKMEGVADLWLTAADWVCPVSDEVFDDDLTLAC